MHLYRDAHVYIYEHTSVSSVCVWKILRLIHLNMAIFVPRVTFFSY